MNNRWILVTGANGFLGARLVKKLVERGHRVKAFVRAGADLRLLRDLPTDQVRIAVGDCRYEDRVYAALRGCDTMFHVAGSYCLDEKRRTTIFEDTVGGAEATLEAARRAGLSKIVFTSSAVTLGASAQPEPMDESHFRDSSVAPSYVQAKVAAERVALERVEAGLPIVIVNPADMFGPGDFKPTPSGARIVDYLNLSPSFKVPIIPGGFSVVDVDDVAEGQILAYFKGRVGERYALASENFDTRAFYQMLSDITGLSEPGDDMSLGQAKLLAIYEELKGWWAGSAPKLTRRSLDSDFAQYRFVSSDKAKRELGFSPRPAREALTRSCHYFLDHGYVEQRAARRARLELRPA